jgi:hypothetical protein
MKTHYTFSFLFTILFLTFLLPLSAQSGKNIKVKSDKKEKGTPNEIYVSIFDFVQALPVPGQSKGFLAKDTIIKGETVPHKIGIVVQNMDTTWHITYPKEAPIPMKDIDVLIFPISPLDLFKVSSKGTLGIEMIIHTTLYRKDDWIELFFHFADTANLKTGRVLRIARGEARIRCYCFEKMNQQAFKTYYTLYYAFGDSAVVRWDSAQSRIVWSGFTAELKR